jgi:hypothetical protein
MNQYCTSFCYAFISATLILFGWGKESGWAQETSPSEALAVQEELEPAGLSDKEPVEEETSPLPLAEGTLMTEATSEEEAGSEEGFQYTVKEGDTLWDITQSIWQDPFLWPKVWRNNPYVINPDLIYPGNVLVFPPRMPEVAEEEPPAPTPPPVVEAPPPAVEVPPVPTVPAVTPPEVPPPAKPELDLSLLASSGYILYGEKPSAKVVGGLDERELVGENDIAYILPVSDTTLEKGDRLTLFRNVRKVYHPKTRKYIGDLIKILGVAEITLSAEQVKTAQIVTSYDYITKGDSALPYESLELALSLAEKSVSEGHEGGPSDGLEGYIIDIKDERIASAQYDIVYIDRGLSDGVNPGDLFVVVREGDKIARGVNLPRRNIGRLEVLMAQDKTATARIIQSTEVILKGDKIEVSFPP